MKGKTPKMFRSVMAVLLAVLMVAGSFGSVFAAEQKAIEDVTVGDIKNAIAEAQEWVSQINLDEALGGIYTEIEKWAESEDGQAAIEAVKEAIADAQAKIAEEIAKLEGEAAQAAAEIQAAIAELEATVKALEEKLAEKEAELEAAIPEIEAAVAEEIAKLEAQKAQLQAEVAQKVAEAQAALDAKLAEIAELKAQFEAENSEEIAAAIAAAEAALPVLEEAVATAASWLAPTIAEIDAKIAEVKADTDAAIIASIEEAIANIENAIAETKATIAELQTALENVCAAYKALGEDIEEAAAKLEALINAEIAKIDVEALEAGVDAVIAEIKASAEEVFAIYEAYGDDTPVMALVNAAVAEAEELAAKAAAAAEELVPYINAELAVITEALEAIASDIDVESVKESVEEVAALVEELAENINAVGTAAIQGAINVVNTSVAAVEAGIDEIIAYIEGIFADAVEGTIYLTADTTYFGIGDSYMEVAEGESSFVDLVAAELGITAAEFAMSGCRVEDIRAIIDDSFAGDEYTEIALESLVALAGLASVEELKALVKEAIAEADFITVAMGNDNFTSYIFNQLLETAVLDWEQYVGAETAAQIDELRATAVAELAVLIQENFGEYIEADETASLFEYEELAAMLFGLVENYAYSAVGFALNYNDTINAIHAINPEAEVALIGVYNPFDGMVIEGIDIGSYVDYIVALINFDLYSYALLTDNTTFIDIPETETILEAAEESEEDVILYLLAILTGELAPSADGHEYIKDQILDAIKIEGLLGDVNLDGKVDAKDATQILRKVNLKTSVWTNLEGKGIEVRDQIADVDKDGKVDAKDATQILRYANLKTSVFDRY